MAVKRYDGSAWQTVAGLGAQGPAATSSSIATWVKTASGGETSVSGNDDSSQPLSYTVGQELVFINGVLQKRGDDYTATTGNSITGLTALTAGDIVSVWTVNAFSVTNAISNTIMDAKGDLLTASSADVPARLAVGANNTVLTADSSTATGLKWATPAAGGKVLQVVQATYGVSTQSTSTTWADTGLSATITPSATSSKILVLVNQPFELFRSSTGAGGGIRLLRGSTFIWGDEAANSGGSLYSSAGGSTSRQVNYYHSFSYVDSPSTTSATTYKTQLSVNDTSNSGRMTVQYISNDSSIILMEIGA
jgi:hypothetical protein